MQHFQHSCTRLCSPKHNISQGIKCLAYWLNGVVGSKRDHRSDAWLVNSTRNTKPTGVSLAVGKRQHVVCKSNISHCSANWLGTCHSTSEQYGKHTEQSLSNLPASSPRKGWVHLLILPWSKIQTGPNQPFELEGTLMVTWVLNVFPTVGPCTIPFTPLVK